MKTDMQFPLGLWLIGWVITCFAVYSSYVLEAIWEYFFLTFVVLITWPIIMGLFIGETWSFVR